MKVYISGPMTGIEDYNFPAFHQAAERLQAAGYRVENPASKGVIDGWTWSDYLRHDLRQLLECDAICLLPGWRNSKGATLEHHVATGLGMAVVDLP